MKEYNKLHYAAFMDSTGMLHHCLFCQSSEQWEGESLGLKAALIQATRDWKTLTGGGTPCPVVFNPNDVCKTLDLDAKQREMDELQEVCSCLISSRPDGLVPIEHYEEAIARSRELKKDGLKSVVTEEEMANIKAHWPFDNMNKEDYTY